MEISIAQAKKKSKQSLIYVHNEQAKSVIYLPITKSKQLTCPQIAGKVG